MSDKELKRIRDVIASTGVFKKIINIYDTTNNDIVVCSVSEFKVEGEECLSVVFHYKQTPGKKLGFLCGVPAIMRSLIIARDGGLFPLACKVVFTDKFGYDIVWT